MRLNVGDKIVLGEGIGIVCLDCNDRVYFRWENGDLSWVYREDILDVKRKRQKLNKTEYNIVDISKKAKEIHAMKIAELNTIISKKRIEYNNLSLAQLLSENKLVYKCRLAIELTELNEKLKILSNL